MQDSATLAKGLTETARKLDSAIASIDSIAKSVSGHEIDCTYTELIRDDSGLATSVVTDALGGEVELSVDRNFPYLQVYTGDKLERGRRRTAIAVEPMTCPPDAFRSGVDLTVLRPGARWTGAWGLVPRG